jgi:tRNA 5-methylaminomethyl-2-thiouridine biosynthesis bifunctional protein
MLTPAAIRFDVGSPRSTHFEDRYHGDVGGLAQARGVFLAGCGLPAGWRRRAHFTVVETGFGFGFNFLACWAAWQEDPERCERLHFLSIERHPVALHDLARAHASEPSLADFARQLRRALPPVVTGCHRIVFATGKVQLTLVYGDGAAALAELEAQADALFLDGFAPGHNPELWNDAVLTQLARLARPGARLATWCAAGALRRALCDHGFASARGPGFASKRASTHAVRLGTASAAPPAPADVMIIGAGLAGCQLAERLTRRGSQVMLLDAAAGPAQAASGNPSGVVRPLLSRDDNQICRFTRAAFLHAVQLWSGTSGAASASWHPGGVLQIAQDSEQFEQWRAALEALGMPAEFAWLMGANQARRRTGLQHRMGGLMFPLGGWAQPRHLCAEALVRCGTRLVTHWNAGVQAVVPAAGGGWQAVDTAGRILGQASHAVLAVGAGPAGGPVGPDFLPPGLRPLQALRGEITQVRSAALDQLDVVVCGDGYLSPHPDGGCSIGATYDRSGDAQLSAAGTASNLTRLCSLSGLDGTAVQINGGRVAWRSVAADRVPMVGADPQAAQLWHLRALASRGLVWSALCAELLASEMHQEPLPIARSLRDLVSPQRPSLKARPGP